MMRRSTIGVITAVMTLGIAGIAIGADQLVDKTSTAVLVDVDAPVIPPPGPGNHGAAHQTSRIALRAHLEPSGPTYLANTDWGSARSFAIPGTDLRGWTFDRPGKRCLALPDPVAEGYGVTCNTAEEIAAGAATVMVLSPTGAHAPNIVGALVADGGMASVETPPGTKAQWDRFGDVYVGTAPTGSRFLTGSRSQSVRPPSAEVAQAPPQP